MPQAADSDRPFFLSTLAADSAQRRLALGVLLGSALLFAVLAPFAKMPLAHVWAFIPIYEASLTINDLITAVLLFGQFRILRLQALLVLACGYLFTALAAVVHALSFPGLFSLDGLLGRGATPWLYMAWHGGFPLFVMAYCGLKHSTRQVTTPWRHTLVAAALVLVVIAGCGATVGWGQGLLPPLLVDNHYTPIMLVVVGTVWSLSLAALLVLWWRQPHSVLDLWLMVVLCAWLFDIALSAMLNAGRFDLGFYAGRIYGLAAASFVLAVLLLENGMLYARLLTAHHASQRDAARLLAANKELEAFSYSISHDLRSPLRAINGFSALLERRSAGQLDAEGLRLLGVVRESCSRMGQLIDDLLEFSRLGRQPLSTRPFALEDLVNQTIEELRPQAAGRDIVFDVAVLGEVRGDPSLLKQVLLNLIGNAIKFTRHRQQAKVSVGCRPNEAQDRVFFVQDNGAGFDMRYADKLFGVFQRLHGMDEFEGTGVGLAIVQRVIQRHGGQVWAEAKPDSGATFYFTLATRGDLPEQA